MIVINFDIANVVTWENVDEKKNDIVKWIGKSKHYIGKLYLHNSDLQSKQTEMERCDLWIQFFSSHL